MKNNILYINPGPTIDPHSAIYRARFEELSQYLSGYIFTTARTGETISIRDFTFFSMARGKNTTLKKLSFICYCIWHALKLSNGNNKIDLVSTYDPLYTGMIGVIVSKLLKAKLVVEVNGVYTSASEWVDNSDAPGTKLKKRAYPWIMHFVLKRADGIKLLFKEQIAPFKKIIRGKILRDFPNFVTIDHFKNIREEKEVLFVGFPFKRKGVDILIEAFKKVAPQYPDWKLKILGWFPNPRELNDAIAGHTQIYHHPPVKHNEMPDHIGSCGIFVLPSRSEAMGRVLVEAMAAGKPRIGSRVDGIPTVINDGVDGLLFESEDVNDLADKLNSLMSNPGLRQRLGRAAEIRAIKEFTKELYCKNITLFYEEIFKNAGN